MSQTTSFLKHNNAVPIALFAVFGITTASFAASPEVRSAVYDSKQEVRQVDNTYIVSADVTGRDFRMQVTDVKEDTDTFYVTYAYKDISLVGYVWQEADATGSLTISKKELEGRDLGLYVAKQLGEVVGAKRAFLVGVQGHERKVGATPKVVATTYSGIVGKFLDPEEQTFPGYVAVIAPESSTYNNPIPALGVPDPRQGDAVAASVSLPNTNANGSQVQLTQAEIEQLVAEQVRTILSDAAAPSSDTVPVPAPATEPVVEPASTSTSAEPAPSEPVTEPVPPEPIVAPAPIEEPVVTLEPTATPVEESTVAPESATAPASETPVAESAGGAVASPAPDTVAETQ